MDPTPEVRHESLTETLSVLRDPEALADLAESAKSEAFDSEEEMAELMTQRFGRA